MVARTVHPPLYVPQFLHTISGFFCLTIFDHIISISLGYEIRTGTGCADEAGKKGRSYVETTHTRLVPNIAISRNI